MNIDLNKYKQFVEAVTSKPSNDLTTFMDRCDELDANYVGDGVHGPDVNVPLLLTACIGLAAESGEFIEVSKKMYFQGNPLTAAEVFQLTRVFGDVLWYSITPCRPYNLDHNDFLAEIARNLHGS